MKYAVDLHIHTCLSPCADNDMTPNNIVNMALIKGLDAIAITDHNSSKNVYSVIKSSKDRILVLPAMEIESKEEVHLLSYFKKLSDLEKLNRIVFKHLPKKKINTGVWGRQIIMDSFDKEVGEIDKLLATSTDLSVEEIFKIVKSLNGIVIPAHIDRDSYSITSNLGFIPENLNVNTVEIMKKDNLKKLKLENYKHIFSSDAHSLGDILERENFIDINNLTLDEIFNYLQY